MLQTDVRSAMHFAATVCYLNPIVPSGRDPTPLRASSSFHLPSRAPSFKPISYAREAVEKKQRKPSICTADELHYVSVPSTDWRLALWRYTPSPKAPQRNHPLLLLSGVGTNAIGFDLAPESSFARYMSGQGFDTWILEVRGAGLSKFGQDSKAIEPSTGNSAISEVVKSFSEGVKSGSFSIETDSTALSESETSIIKSNGSEMVTVKDNSQQLASKLAETFLRLAERLSGFLSEGQSRVMSAKFIDKISKILEDAQLSERYNDIRGKLSGLLEETRQNSAIGKQARELSQRIVSIIEEGQRSVSPQFFDLRERLSTTIEDFQKQLDLIVKYDWDFDSYLEEDVPAAMEYIRAQCKPKDGKLLAIGHSMGGILLYAMLSQSGFESRQSGLAAVVTLASSLDYTNSKSSLKLLLPLADPAQAFNVPAFPLGVLLAAAYPLSTHPPYVLSWLNPVISAEDMMHPELLEKLVMNNFCTIPMKLLLQLSTAFRYGGLCNRSGTFYYKDHLHKCSIPILALAGDQDLICPPEAVHETVKIIPQHLVNYKIFGKPDGAHYGHYDLVGGRLAIDEVYPCIIEFLTRHDGY